MHPDASAYTEVSSQNCPFTFHEGDSPAQAGSLWVLGLVGEAEMGHVAA